ncbi:M56 family metallopeptidase [Hymenobacter sp. NBH84]|uniref:M56 family metallopeptidase n=1 Tax=Hymenobacter sp. NBH84 TaxID=2596915 RepID=UPI001626BB6A|nr:M56 family metallopeptidase [Hymenobacter sp. NBH84]
MLLFVFYKIALENERLNTFKRFYLLGSLLVSAVVPMLSVEVAPSVAVLTTVSPESVFVQELPPAPPSVAAAPTPSTPEAATPPYWLLLYCIVTAVLMGRFGRNLYRLARQITDHPKEAFRRATLVRLPTGSVPYTFLHYLFVPETAYQRGEIEEELFTHELTHIRQRHSLDVLLIEWLLCLAWFNPLLYWCRRAMQLNHEFLADEAVNSSHHNVLQYQQLLLSKLTPTPLPLLASTLTFQTTKQRLLMMTKHTSRRTVWLAGSFSGLLVGTSVFLFSTTAAQEARPETTSSAPAKIQRPATLAKADTLLQRYGDKLVMLPNNQQKKYADLTPEERKWVWVAPISPRRTPTEAQWADWHNPHKFGIWVDGKRVRGKALNAYKRTDIVAFLGSYVHKNARQPEGYLYQMDLTTEKGYAEEVREHEESPFMVLMRDKPRKQNQPKKQQPKPQSAVQEVLQQYGDVPVYDKPTFKADSSKVYKYYSALTDEERKRVVVGRFTHMPLRTPTEKQWAA